MQPVAEAAGWLFGWLLRNSAHAAILAALVWLLERTIGRGLPPRWRYGLWLVVVVRLLLPVAPTSHLSLFNLVDLAPASVAGAALQVLGLPAPVVVPAPVEAPDPLADTPSWFVWALALWVPGALALATIVARDQRRLSRALAATTPLLDTEVLDLLRQGKAVMSVRRRVMVVETGLIRSPAISGWLRPRLLLPSGLLERLTSDEVRFLFLHELAHVKRADLAFNWILAAIQILHWFNPVVWLVLRRLLAVREEVCDDLVLRRCFAGASREYGLTLLRLLEECAPRRLIPGLAGVLDDVDALRQRIRWIRNFGMQDRHPCLAAGLTVAVAIVGLTERIAEPFFAHTPSPLMADVTVDHARRPKPWTAPGRRGPGHGTAKDGEIRRNPDTASRFVGTLTVALQQAATEARPRETSAGPPIEPVGAPVAAGVPAVRSVSPNFIPITANRNAPVQFRAGTRPYPLPPVSERGDIIRPPRPNSDRGSWDPAGWRSLETVRSVGRPMVIPRQSL